jgi:hypothetical protein
MPIHWLLSEFPARSPFPYFIGRCWQGVENSKIGHARELLSMEHVAGVNRRARLLRITNSEVRCRKAQVCALTGRCYSIGGAGRKHCVVEARNQVKLYMDLSSYSYALSSVSEIRRALYIHESGIIYASATSVMGIHGRRYPFCYVACPVYLCKLFLNLV